MPGIHGKSRPPRGPSVADAYSPASRGEWYSAGDHPGGLRPEVVRLVREQVRTGRYRPPVGDVAEQLVAWLFPEGPRAGAGHASN